MRPRPARLIVSALGWITLAAAGGIVYVGEQSIAGRRAQNHVVDLLARESATAIADARAGQQAYVAVGQSGSFWVPKVAALTLEAQNRIDRLRGLSSDGASKALLVDAAASLAEFGNLDRQARDYLSASEPLMAGDMVFTEGGAAAARAARQVEAARIKEREAFDAFEGAVRRREAWALGSGAVVIALLLLLLSFAPPVPSADDARIEAEPDPAQTPTPEQPTASAVTPAVVLPGTETVEASALIAAAELCTAFQQARDADELRALVGRAADLMDAAGLIVWVGDATGAVLTPALAHGYSDQILVRLGDVPRMADNAAAAAYRSGSIQVVTGRPGLTLGAIVVPLVSPAGCIGALAAEIRHEGETSHRVRALAALFSAQLATIVSPRPPAASAQARAVSA